MIYFKYILKIIIIILYTLKYTNTQCSNWEKLSIDFSKYFPNTQTYKGESYIMIKSIIIFCILCTRVAVYNLIITIICRHQDCDYTKYEQPKIYNYVSSADSPLTWNKYIEGISEHYYASPPLRSMWYGFYIACTNLWICMVLNFFLHQIPAAFVDFLLIISGKSPK